MAKYKLGVQTLTWGDNFPISKAALEKLSRLGIEGVEIAQNLVEDVAVNFAKSLQEFDLRITGITAGSIAKKVTLLKHLKSHGMSPDYTYLAGSVSYIEKTIKSVNTEKDWRELFTRSPIAIHPYFYKGVECTNQIEHLFKKNETQPQVKLIPDIAHLYLKDESVLETLKSYKDSIAAIHIKDWSSKHGRNFLTYSRGFCEIGSGELGDIGLLREVKNWIDENYTGWVVLEIDHTSGDPIDCIEASLRWWQNDGAKNLKSHRLRKSSIDSSKAGNVLANKIGMNLVNAAGASVHQFYHGLCREVCKQFRCAYVNLWEVDTRNQELYLQASCFQRENSIRDYREDMDIVSIEKCAAREALEGPAPFKIKDLNEEPWRSRFQDVNLLNDLSLKKLVSIPIRNSYNRDQIVLLLNCFWDAPCENPDEIHSAIRSIEPFFSRTFESVIENAKAQIFEELNAGFSPFDRYVDLLEEAHCVISGYVECDIFSVLTYEEKSNTLLCQYSSSSKHAVREPRFHVADPLLFNAIKRKEPILVRDRKDIKNSYVLSKFCQGGLNYIIKPILNDRGIVRSVVICGRSDRVEVGRKTRYFTYTDDALLDFIYLATKEQFRAILTYEQSIQTMRKIRHEMSHPSEFVISTCKEINKLIKNRKKNDKVIKSVRGLMTRRLISGRDLGLGSVNVKGISDYQIMNVIEEKKETVFDLIFDVIAKLDNDVLDYQVMLHQKIADLGFFRQCFEVKPDQSKAIHLQSEVLMPIKQHSRMLLRDADLPEEFVNKIFVDAKEIGPLYLDKKLWTHLTFNLVENAIKYRSQEDNYFSLEISGNRTILGDYELRISDWGVGIDTHERELIFDEFTRGQFAKDFVTGEGIGLWMVKQIVEAHGGTIVVEETCNPTVFLIKLPASLRLASRTER